MLNERLNGILEAEDEADKIIKDAKEKAQNLIYDAEKKSKDMIKDAETKAKRNIEEGRHAAQSVADEKYLKDMAGYEDENHKLNTQTDEKRQMAVKFIVERTVN